ncbi:MAG: LLM class flavin-dependent oxidoreductase [Gammaproteobacteria bacterium]
MPISFGLFDHLDARDEPVAKTFSDRLEFIRNAEEGGFRTYHLAEHHSTPLGMGPSPGIFLAAVAQATSRIRLGPLVYLLPLYNPLRLIEEICMLDHLSAGRLDVGVGRGVSPIELGFFGVDADSSAAIAAEALEVIKLGITNERLTHHGEHFDIDDVPMSIQAFQADVPFWAASMSPDGLQNAARAGMHSALLGSVEMIKEAVEIYQQALPMHNAATLQGMLRLIVIADSDTKADELAREALEDWFQKLIKLWREYDVQAPLVSAMGDFDFAKKAGIVVSGTSSKVSDILHQQVNETGVNYLLAQMAFGNLPHAEEMASLDYFVSDVMPSFQ